MTGTPIQNSLDDLRSLLKFLHFQPFAAQSFFEKHIIEPLRSGSHDSFRNLKLLLRVICLRRNASYLQLPRAETEVVPITLTPEERAVYDGILADCQAEFDRIVSTKSEIKKYNALFTTIMKLRQLCNHGTVRGLRAAIPRSPMLFDKRRRLKKQQISTDRELFCEFCGGEDEDTAPLVDSLETCPECYRCLKSPEASLPRTSISWLSPASPLSSLAPSTSASPSSTPQSPSPMSPNSSFGLQEGYSSKLVAVVDNIQKSLNNSKRQAPSPTYKFEIKTSLSYHSLVFTSWRSTLDILAHLLTDRGIPWLRIDGQVSFSDRSEILSKFSRDSNIPILLISIGTGAVGYDSQPMLTQNYFTY